MSDVTTSPRLYEGQGVPLSTRGRAMPLFQADTRRTDPKGYRPDLGLLDAVHVALRLGQPLLLTGEPGTGKTQLAYAVAYELDLYPPLVFHTKSTSVFTDLFYRYDALRNFRDVLLKRETPVHEYIEYQALGLAIQRAMDRSDPNCPLEIRNTPQQRSVVLIDEIDKAPRDFPNDILTELEDLEFEVKETGGTFAAERKYWPVLIITSNQEKDLPEAFRRRCVFYDIPFPKDEEQLAGIVHQRMSLSPSFTQERLQQAIRYFIELRKLPLEKMPATAELLAWIEVLDDLNCEAPTDDKELSPQQRAALMCSFSVLAKSLDDLKQLRNRTSAFAVNA